MSDPHYDNDGNALWGDHWTAFADGKRCPHCGAATEEEWQAIYEAAHRDPSDSRELVLAALRKWGWTCGPDFWDRYHQDPWVFNLVNALTRTTTVNEQLVEALRYIAEPDDLLDANEGAFNQHAARRMQAQAQYALSTLISKSNEVASR